MKIIYILLQTPLSGKILLLTLWVKMLSANHVAGFFKRLYFKKEKRDQVDLSHLD